jgi:hypothetical protein
LLQAVRQALLVGPDVLVREATQDFVGFRDGAVDGLKDLEGMLLDDVERALDALRGALVDGPVVGPGRIGEQERRPDERGRRDQAQGPDEIGFAWSMRAA